MNICACCILWNELPQGSDHNAVTGLFFKSENRETYLFAVTLQIAVVFALDRPDTHMTVLDEHGAEPNCVTMTHDSELVLGREEAVYFYGIDGRGPCFAFDGKKLLMECFRGNLICVMLNKTNQR